MILGLQVIMIKTVICHFYNEEYLLPLWLKHHCKIFDNGIMIDYNSTDRSVEIIRDLCPTWQIVQSRNDKFDAYECDREVEDYEGIIKDWRIALNVTEFIYGNFDRLNDRNEDQQIILSNYIFADMEDTAKGSGVLDSNMPIHKQRYWGYHQRDDVGRNRPGHSVRRQHRSIHNFPINYADHPGRHFPEMPATYDDLVIFYYGYADASYSGLIRKAQIQTKMSQFDINRNSGGHVATPGDFLNRIRVDHQPKSRDLRSEFGYIIKHNERTTRQEW